VAVDGALGDEQAGADLFVTRAHGDQVRDLRLSVAEWRRVRGLCMRSDKLRGFTERKCNRGGSSQLLSGGVLGLEVRCAKRRVGGATPHCTASPRSEWT
jgi:hypothetical protein